MRVGGEVRTLLVSTRSLRTNARLLQVVAAAQRQQQIRVPTVVAPAAVPTVLVGRQRLRR